MLESELAGNIKLFGRFEMTRGVVLAEDFEYQPTSEVKQQFICA